MRRVASSQSRPDRAPLLDGALDRRVPTSRKLAVLTLFQLKQSVKSGRVWQVFLPLLFYLTLMASSRSAFPDQYFPADPHPSSFFSASVCGVSEEQRASLALGVVCARPLCPEATAALGERLGVGNVTSFASEEALMETMLASQSLWTGVSWSETDSGWLSIELAMRGSSLPSSVSAAAGRDGGSSLACRPGQQCAVEEYVTGCLSFVAEAALMGPAGGGEIEWKLFPMQAMFVSGLKASSVLWLVPVYVSFLFVNLSVISLVDLAREIERKSIEFMHTHGVPRLLFFASFSLVNLLYGVTQVLVISLVLKNYNIFPTTSPALVGTGLLLFFLFLTSLSFSLARLTNSPRSASLLGTAVDVALLGLGVLGRGQMNAWKFALGILCPSLSLFGFLDQVGEREALGTAATWTKIYPHLGALVLGVALHVWLGHRLWRAAPAGVTGTAARQLSARDCALEVVEASKSFENGTRALRGLNLQLGTSEIVALIGPNGAGKTTLQRCILGLEQLDSGSISVLAEQRVGSCFQEDVLMEDMSVADHVRLVQRLHAVSDEKVSTVQTQLDIGTTDILSRKIQNLSGGEKRRVSLLLTLLNDSAGILVLDEPTAGVDVEGRRHMWQAIRLDRRPCIISTHYLDEATEIADRIVLMRDGEVVEDVDVKDERMTAKILTVRPAHPAVLHAFNSFFPDVEVSETEDGLTVTVTDKQAQATVACVQYLENCGLDTEISVETQSLEALLAARISDQAKAALERDIELLNRPRGPAPSTWKAAVAFARLRVTSKLHSVRAAAAHFLIPLAMVAASIAVVKLNRFLMGNAGGPQMDGPLRKTNFSDPHTVGFGNGNGAFVVPFSGSSSFHLPSSVPSLLVEGDMEEFLLINGNYPFALGSSNVVYVNPQYPNALPYAIGVLSGSEAFSLVPVLSVLELTFLSFPALLPFVLYFALALHRLAVDGAVVVAEEKSQQHVQFWKLHGLEISSYWLGTFLGQLALCLPVVVGMLSLGSILFGLGEYWGFLVLTAAVNTTGLLLTSFLHAQKFPSILTADAFLKWYPAISGFLYESCTVAAAVTVTALYSRGEETWKLCLSVHAVASLVVPTYPLVGALIFALIQKALCTGGAAGLAQRCEDEAGRIAVFLWTPVLAQSLLAMAGLWWLRGERETRPLERLALSVDEEDPQRRPDEGHEGQALAMQNVYHSYDGESWAVKNLSLAVRGGNGRGEVVALLGPNGSGKSTAMQIATKFLFPTAGRVEISDVCGVGYCAQQTRFLFKDGRGLDNLRLVGDLRGLEEGVVERLSVASELASRSVREMSTGMRRRLEVMVALIGNVQFVILDEPTSGVDVEKKREIWKMIGNSKQVSVLLSSHSMEEVGRLAHKVLVLKKGERVRNQDNRKFLGVKVWGSTGNLELPSAWKKVGEGRYLVDVAEFTTMAEILATLEKNKRERVISNYAVGGSSVEDEYLECVNSSSE